MANTIDARDGEQVRIQLFTRQPDLEIPGLGPILVPTKFSRLHVSKLLNQSLEREKPIALEILINGTFLRTSIHSFLTQHGISTETTLSVEYTHALLPPTYQTSFEHDDWVGAVDVLSLTSPAGQWDSAGLSTIDTRILTGSFDGLLRIWNPSGSITATSALCSPADSLQQWIHSAKFLDSSHIVSSGFNVPVRLWSYSESAEGATPTITGTLTPILDLFGQASSNSIAVHTPSKRILSASDDNKIALFSSTPSENPPLPPANSAKRRKQSASSSGPSIPRAGPLTLLSAHTHAATDVIFHPSDPTAAYSTSRDRTLRTWDLVTARSVATRTPSPGNQLMCVTPLRSLGLLAVGTVGGTISLVDPRAHEKAAMTSAVMTLKGFRLSVDCVAADPSREFAVAGGSHDGTVRVFDVRGAVAGGAGAFGGLGVGAKTAREANKIPRRSDVECERREGGTGVKVLGLAWDETVGLCSASEDMMLQIDRVE